MCARELPRRRCDKELLKMTGDRLFVPRPDAGRPLTPWRVPSSACVCGLVWRHLDAHPCERPAVGEIARAIGMTERQLRRRWHAKRVEPLRSLVTYACVTYAWCLIARGTKTEAAIRLAGFRNRWNFNRQSRAFGLRSASGCADGAPLQISADSIQRATDEFLRLRRRAV
jgi:hypothetical protein